MAVIRSVSFPDLVVGADLRLGAVLDMLKARGVSPLLATVYGLCRAANEVPVFRLRIRGDSLIEHERVNADFTVLAGTELASYGVVERTVRSSFQ